MPDNAHAHSSVEVIGCVVKDLISAHQFSSDLVRSSLRFCAGRLLVVFALALHRLTTEWTTSNFVGFENTIVRITVIANGDGLPDQTGLLYDFHKLC